MRLVALAILSLHYAGAAFAQDVPACERTDGRIATAKKAFVDRFQAATVALQAHDWAGALEAAALARPHAVDQKQLAAVIQVEVAAYHEVGTPAAREQILETALAAPCLPAMVRNNYREMLDRLRGGGVAPQPQ